MEGTMWGKSGIERFGAVIVLMSWSNLGCSPDRLDDSETGPFNRCNDEATTGGGVADRPAIADFNDDFIYALAELPTGRGGASSGPAIIGLRIETVSIIGGMATSQVPRRSTLRPSTSQVSIRRFWEYACGVRGWPTHARRYRL